MDHEPAVEPEVRQIPIPAASIPFRVSLFRAFATIRPKLPVAVNPRVTRVPPRSGDAGSAFLAVAGIFVPLPGVGRTGTGNQAIGRLPGQELMSRDTGQEQSGVLPALGAGYSNSGE